MNPSVERIYWGRSYYLGDQTMTAGATQTGTSDQSDATSRVIEDFRPLAQCLEWRVSEVYWQEKGLLPFLQKEVPFLVNNSGRLSDSCARMLLANCLESPPEGRVTVLECGAGCGLFARLFLDSFRSLCAAGGHDFYQRLDMWVTDGSPATIEQWSERGVFSGHAGHVRTEVLGVLGDFPINNVRAAFGNYLMDSLPAAVVRAPAPGVYEQLCVRTRLGGDAAAEPAHIRLMLEDARRAAASPRPIDLAHLFPLLPRFEYDYAFRGDGAASVPGVVEALADERPGRAVLLNFGALQCLDRLASKLSPDGFILLNDYGTSQQSQLQADSKGVVRAERFGKTSAMRVNFPVIEQALRRQALIVTKPSLDETRDVHARLVTRRSLNDTAEAFEREFGTNGTRHVRGLTDELRKKLSAGDKLEATARCQSIVAQSPHDWSLLGDVAVFFLHDLSEPEKGLEFARAAIGLNPLYSAELWNILAGCFFALQRFDEAHEACLQAQKIDPHDATANVSLGYSFIRAGDSRSALQAIARGLQGDVKTRWREQLLQAQKDALAVLSLRRLREKSRPAGVVDEALAFLSPAGQPATSDAPPYAISRMLEDFQPLARCLEARVSEVYWQARPVFPFLQKEVPFLVNDSGRLADSSARLLLASCLESPPEGRIVVLEVGAGCGLFSRLFLDSFRSLCAAGGHDFYQRLDMWVTAGSPTTIQQWAERGVFAEHAGHVATRILGALDHLPMGDVRALFCNYLLDTLPAAVIRAPGPGVYEQLCVRTRLVEGESVVQGYTRLTFDDFRKAAGSSDPLDLVRLSPLLALFEHDFAFRSDGAAEVPGIVEALAEEQPDRAVLFNFGALQCLDRWASRLSPDGFILLHEYGGDQPSDSEAVVRAERLARTSPTRVNFPVIAQALRRRGFTVTTPSLDETRRVDARLITRRSLSGTAETFECEFGTGGTRPLHSLTEEVRKRLMADGKAEAIAWCRSVIAQSPHDWSLIGEMAEFLRYDLREPRIALKFARIAIALNPWYSAWLWNVLGACLHGLERLDEALEAYLQAQKIDPLHPTTNLQLAYHFMRGGDSASALQAIARGLEGDVNESLGKHLLEAQRHALLTVSMQRMREKSRPARVLDEGLASLDPSPPAGP
jgi:tetratricopeptide (TPR) repeat protein